MKSDYVKTLLMHVGADGEDPLSGARFMVVPNENRFDECYAIAMVLDGWYTTKESALDAIPFWDRVLQDVVESID